ncbi:uncharacterized protein LOC124398163 isoform X2 [Silurus meridionalis]|uniref:Uncharacterized protein n=1 Tax=Silurus meridionalis TaxID=175797 RepID=A0A8T0AXC6_SILME|nr:uncharacterized protein LOC124398163 isoform X2 [Silurus meridionalis]KAF7697029.1 hypothetical protein HF521_005447 [Silurus meridionalis]
MPCSSEHSDGQVGPKCSMPAESQGILMANMSGPLTFVDMQTIKLAFTWERVLKMCLVVFTQLLFIYINIVMLFTLRTKAIFRETPRYILFTHMLLNDTIHLLIALLLYMLSSLYFVMVRAACACIVILSTSTFVNAPLNLALMSLERAIILLVTYSVYHCTTHSCSLAAGQECDIQSSAVHHSGHCVALYICGHPAAGP